MSNPNPKEQVLSLQETPDDDDTEYDDVVGHARGSSVSLAACA